jgi:hypothetical protein
MNAAFMSYEAAARIGIRSHDSLLGHYGITGTVPPRAWRSVVLKPVPHRFPAECTGKYNCPACVGRLTLDA